MTTVQPKRLFGWFVLFFLCCYVKINAQTTWSTLIKQKGKIYAVSFYLTPSADSSQVNCRNFEIMEYDSVYKALSGFYQNESEQTVSTKEQVRFEGVSESPDDPTSPFSLLLNLPAVNDQLTGVVDIPALEIRQRSLHFSSLDIMDQVRSYIVTGKLNDYDTDDTVTQSKGMGWLPVLGALLALTVALFFIRRFYYSFFHDRNKLSLPVIHDDIHFHLPYPIIRFAFIKGWRKKKKLLLLTPEGVTFAAVPDESSLANLYTTPWKDQWKQAAFLREKKSFSYADIVSFSGSQNAITRELQFKLRSGNKTTRFYLPTTQSDLCQHAFVTALGNRYQTTFFRENGKEVAGCILLWIAGIGIALFDKSATDAPVPFFPVFLLAILLGNIIKMIYIWIQLRFYEQLMVQQIRLPAINIARLRWLGITLKILLAVVMLCWLPGYLNDNLTVLNMPLLAIPDWMLVPYETLHFNNGILTFAIVGNLACFAYFLQSSSFSKINNKPLSILYMYAASDYGAHSLNGKGGKWAKWAGIQNPFPSLKKKEPGSLAYVVALCGIRYLYQFHPIRIIRILLGKPQDTTREQLSIYARSKGRLDTPVPPREYFFHSQSSDENADCLSRLEKDTFTHAILQPYYRETNYGFGIEKVVNQMPASRLLFCLVHFQDNPEQYEKFRMQLMQWLPACQVPQHLGLSNKIHFLSFDDHGQPRLFSVKQYSGLRTFFKNTSVDLEGTLQSFFK